ncbi:MAG TPA: fumarylacetoacetate hydrolase family protein [Povalibacter sp.]|nr:fumarylacetoacetate hydrolase family protein [Povalibacter sp.]
MGNSSLAGTLLLCLSACMALTACISTQQRVATAVLDAQRRKEPLPLPHRIDETLTITTAYATQRRIAEQELHGAQPAGYKAGLTSKQIQTRFNASQPVASVLPPDGLRRSGDTIRLSEFPGLVIETEVALRVGSPIHEQLSSIDELRARIDRIAPAIELPVVHFQSPEQMNFLDIIATNGAVATYVVGDFAPSAQRDPNEAEPHLVCDGRELNSGKGRDSMGDQWHAALWLVNTILDQGWTLEPGQILLTGVLGRMVPGTPGECSANYGNWGTIRLRIAQ